MPPRIGIERHEGARAIEIGFAQDAALRVEADAPHERCQRVERALHRERLFEREADDLKAFAHLDGRQGRRADAHAR
jgi:hypothetical protein